MTTERNFVSKSKVIDVGKLIGNDQPMQNAVQAAHDALEGAALIRTMRKRADGGKEITAAELARRLSVKPSRISAAEKGSGIQGPTYGLLKRIARACNLKFDGHLALDKAEQKASERPNTAVQSDFIEAFAHDVAGQIRGMLLPEPPHLRGFQFFAPWHLRRNIEKSQVSWKKIQDDPAVATVVCGFVDAGRQFGKEPFEVRCVIVVGNTKSVSPQSLVQKMLALFVENSKLSATKKKTIRAALDDSTSLNLKSEAK